MQYRYAVVEPSPAGRAPGRVVSRHSMLHKALEAKQARAGTQVRELVAPVYVGDHIHYSHLRRWDD